MLSIEIQEAIYAQLKASVELSAIIVDVYDNVPQVGSAADNDAFPYVVIGDDSFADDSTNTTTGYDGNIQIRSFARSGGGKKQLKTIESAIYKALNRSSLTIDNGFFIGLTYVNSSPPFQDPDGKTQTAITNFRILVDNL
jgi:hypothetical protein